MVAAFIAFGSNLGDRQDHLRGARDALRQLAAIRLERLSALYETEPVGGPPGQADYLNAVAAVATELSARQLLDVCREIETAFGRQRRERWGARTLDLDLLFYGSDILQEPDLIVPHPRLHQRPFVLLPLAELAPGLRHPVLGRSVRELLADAPDAGAVRRRAEEW